MRGRQDFANCGLIFALGLPADRLLCDFGAAQVMATFGNTLPMLRERKSQIFLKSKLEVCVMPILLDQMRPIAFFAVVCAASNSALASA